MKKIIFIIIACILFIFLKYYKKNMKNTEIIYTVGILQTASHPSLDQAKEGFIKQMTKIYGKKITFLIYNCEGSMINAHHYAQQLAANKNINLFYTIASPSTQAMHIAEKDRPIIFTAVSQPHAILPLSEKINVCGISDMIQTNTVKTLLQTVLPETKKIGLLYSLSSFNDEECLKIKNELEKEDFIVKMLPILNETEIPSLLESIPLNEIEVLFSSCDNTVASAISLIVNFSLKHKKPFVACFNDAVYAGALASTGVHYFQSGTKAASLAHMILSEHKKPYELGISTETIEKIYINKKTIDTLGLTIPQTKNELIEFI